MAAAGKVSVVISATDRVTAVVDRVNKRLAMLRAPGEKLQKSLSRFGQLTGLSKVNQGMGRLGAGAKTAFFELSRVITPLSAITGAASLAGMYRLTTAWANFGSKLGFAAQRIGISSSSLQTLQGAARLAGGSAEGLQSGLQTLGQNMWDAVGGRNPVFMSTMRMLGVQFQNTNGSAKSVSQVLPQLADKIAAIKNPYAQAAVAAQVFGSAAEDMLPFLRLGSRGMADYERTAARYGVTNQAGVAAANRLRMAQSRLTLAVEGLGNSIAQELEPVITPLLTNLANWIGDHRALIATKLHEFLDKVVARAKSLWQWSQAVVTSLGGWKAVAEDAGIALGVLFAARTLIGLGKVLFLLRAIGTASGAAIAARIAAASATGAAASGAAAAAPAAAAAVRPGLLRGAGRLAMGAGRFALRAATFSPVGTAALAAAGLWWWALQRGAGKIPGAAWGQLMGHERLNKLDQSIGANILRHQGRLNPGQYAGAAREDIADFMRMGWTRPQANIIEGNLSQESGLNSVALNAKSGAFGLGQWLGSRQADFEKVEGVPLAYATRGQQRDFVNWELHHTEAASGRLLSGMSDESGAAAFGRSYERYGAGEEGGRTGYAQQLAGLDLGGGSAAGAAPTGETDGQFKVLLEILHKNPPAGTQVRARGPNVQVASVRTERAMPTELAGY